MVVAFVGFICGYGKELLRPDQLLLAGVTGAIIATWFTFLPSFLFIFLGAPWIEATRNNLKFSGPLSAITAAVVGVIVNLAIFFSYHVFWPTGISQKIDLISIGISAGASFLLFKRKWSILRIMTLCTILGIIKGLI
jgi:chromate transporter